VQYGLFLSQLTLWPEHVKQSFAAPVAGVRLRFLRGVQGTAAGGIVEFWTSAIDIVFQMIAGLIEEQRTRDLKRHFQCFLNDYR
jgi:hypothetical protein